MADIVSYYADSLKEFHRNGILKRIEFYDSIGTPLSFQVFDKQCRLLEEREVNYPAEEPFHLNKKADNILECYVKKYKKGILISEGLFINRKENGLHIFYKDGREQSRKVFSDGELIE